MSKHFTRINIGDSCTHQHPTHSLSSLLLEGWSTAGTIPLALGLGGNVQTPEVEPLYGAVVVVTADHLPVGHLVAEAVGGLIGVHGHVQHLLGHPRQVGVRVAVAWSGGRGLVLLLLPLLPLGLLHAPLLLVFGLLLDRNLFLFFFLCF